MGDLNLFIPLTKIDAEKRIVYGVATAETLDRSGEICDYASTKPFYEKWSNGIAKATGGKSLGNLRAMHGKVAAGKLVDISFNDGAKQIEVAAKVVDDDEWKKVEEGVYTGFSHGGRYVKKWTGTDGAKRYTAEPSELSLVDYPCVPEAVFEVIKADGVETRHFVAKAEVDEKALIERTWKLGKEQHINNWEDAKELAKAQLVEEGLRKAEIDTGDSEDSEDEGDDKDSEDDKDESKDEGKSDKKKKSEKWVDGVAHKTFWSCGCDGHEHVSKLEAVACAKDRLAKKAAKPEDDSVEIDEKTKQDYLERLHDVVPGLLSEVATLLKEGIAKHEDALGKEACEAAQEAIDHTFRGVKGVHKDGVVGEELEKDWDESKHPRGAGGKFGSGGGGASSKKDEHAPAGGKGEKGESLGEGLLHSLGHVAKAAAAHGVAEFITRAGLTVATAHPAGRAIALGVMGVRLAAQFVAHEAIGEALGSATEAVAKAVGADDPKASGALAKLGYGLYHIAGGVAGAHKVTEIDDLHKALEKLQGALGVKETETAAKAATPQDLEKMIGEEVWDAAAAVRAVDMLFAIRSKEAAEPDNEAAQVASLDRAIAGVKEFIASEIMEDNSGDVDGLFAAAKATLAKLGARNSARDLQALQAIHDHSCGLGAKCSGMEDDASKAAETEGLSKVAAENEVLKSELHSVTSRVEELTKAVEALREMPAAPKAAVFSVDKSADGGAGGKSAEAAYLEKLESLPPDQRAQELMKLSLRVPVPVVR